MPSAMELNLKGDPEDAQHGAPKSAVHFRQGSSLTRYVDERGESEPKGRINEMLSAALQGNKSWSSTSMQEDLKLGMEVTGRLSDADIGKLGKDEFWQADSYSVLLRVARMDTSVQRHVDNILSLQRFDPAIKLFLAISILQGIIISII